MRNERIPMDYHDKKLELQATTVSAYLQEYMIPKDQCASLFFTAADAKFVRSVVFIVATLFDLRALLLEAQILELAATAEKDSRQSIWKSYYTGKRAELFHRGYAVLDEFADASKISTHVLNMLARPPSFSVGPL